MAMHKLRPGSTKGDDSQASQKEAKPGVTLNCGGAMVVAACVNAPIKAQHRLRNEIYVGSPHIGVAESLY